MIIAYHAIFTTYGTWLPNDPRGSYSDAIYREELRLLGDIKYGRQNPQPGRESLRSFWTAARSKLSRPPCFIDDRTRPIVGQSFARVVQRLNLTVHACAIMNDHVHILVPRSRYRIEYLVNQLKGAATRKLKAAETPWTRGCWKIFLNDKSAVLIAAEYIRMNPVRAGLVPQRWDFVTPSTPPLV